MNKTLKISFITVVTYGVHFFFDDIYFKNIRDSINEVINQFGVSHIIAYIIVGVPIFAGTLLISGRKEFVSSLGLDKSFLKALAFSILCTSPMFLGFSLLFDLNTDISLNRILVAILAAAFFEELYFRGFLFGQQQRN